MELKVVNIIATARIKGSFDIEEIAKRLEHVEYNPEIFPGLILRKMGKPTIILFASGKISSHGSKSEIEAKEMIVNTLKEIDELGYVIESAEINWLRVENVVGRANVKKKINLDRLCLHLPFSKYEPIKFPGLIYRPLNSNATCLVFESGKFIIVGCKSESQLKEAFLKMTEQIKTSEKKL